MFEGCIKETPRENEAYTHVRNSYSGTLARLWLFWTPSVLYAFGRLPVRRQAVFFAGVGFAWNVVLSLIQNPTQNSDNHGVQPEQQGAAVPHATSTGLSASL